MNEKKKLIIQDSVLERAPRIKGVRPFGSLVLVEQLNPDEVLGTNLFVKDTAEVGAPQAYVLEFGPAVKAEDLGLKVGDRVLLQGTYVPVPNFDNAKRKRGLVEIHNIKAVMLEE